MVIIFAKGMGNLTIACVGWGGEIELAEMLKVFGSRSENVV